MSFIPRVTLRPGSNGDPNRPPKWFKQALGETVEAANGVLIFTPNAKHPALKDFGIREFGPVADPATMERMQATYREATATKKAWRAQKRAQLAARIAARAERATKEAASAQRAERKAA